MEEFCKQKRPPYDDLWKRKGLKGKEKPFVKGCAFPFPFNLTLSADCSLP